jgi:hypothetical protein
MKESQKPLTFLSGRYFTPQEISEIRETARVFYRLNFTELVLTVCEHLQWLTPAGRYKVDSCAKALKKLETQGLLKLPAKQRFPKRKETMSITDRTDPEHELVGTVRDFEPIAVEPATDGDLKLWNEYVERYHVLGYKRPFGAHQRYFVQERSGRRVGCLLFASSAWALSVRDEWIGWSKRDRAQRLNWVVANTRFLLFPWVQVRNLGSKALSLAARRIRGDWMQRYGYEPVLLETFVEAERYRGTVYQAANWIRLGVTAGRGRIDRYGQYLSTPKTIYVYPLVEDFRPFLCGSGRSDEKTEPTIATTGAERAETRTEGSRLAAAAASGSPGVENSTKDDHMQRQERVDYDR